MPHNPAEIESEIRLRLSAGDLAAAATLALRGYGPAVLGYYVAMLQDHDEGCDAFSRFSEQLWKALPGFRGESSFRTWAYGIAWFVLKDYRKQAHRRREQTLESGLLSQLVAEVRSTTKLFPTTAKEARLARLRAELSPEEQTLLMLRLDREMSWKDIAVVLGGGEPGVIDVATLRKRFERVREKLTRLLHADLYG